MIEFLYHRSSIDTVLQLQSFRSTSDQKLAVRKWHQRENSRKHRRFDKFVNFGRCTSIVQHGWFRKHGRLPGLTSRVPYGTTSLMMSAFRRGSTTTVPLGDRN